MGNLNRWVKITTSSLAVLMLSAGFTLGTASAAYSEFHRNNHLVNTRHIDFISDAQCENEQAHGNFVSLLKAGFPVTPFLNNAINRSSNGIQASTQAAHPESIALTALVILCLSLLFQRRAKN